MYNIELKRLALEDAQVRVLSSVENLCDTFHMEEQFGVISSAVHLLISLMERCAEDPREDFTLNFYVETENISIQIIDFQHTSETFQMIRSATLEDADPSAYSLSLLTDNIELRNDREIWIDINVKPQFETADRVKILQNESIVKVRDEK